ncbi:MAG: glycosyltransferase family 4 protein [Chloroflexi bacterium]|nr:glycosyltransferase family 4 protein [Chloroflexota bacterium]
MRILLLNSEYPPIGGGAGNASQYLSRSLVAEGHQVTVLTARYGNLPHRENTDGIEVIRIPAWRRRPDYSTAREQGAFIISGLWYAARLIHRERYDVILAFFGAPSGIIAWILYPWAKIPYVVALRGGDVPGFRPYDFATYHRLIGPVLRRVWRRAAAVVANSEGLRELALKFEPSVPIHVIPNGVDPQRFAPPPTRAWDPPRLLFVGRVVYQKGLDVLLKALAQLSADIPWQLTIVGDGPYHAKLEALAQALGIQHRITFAGWQPPKRIPEYYHQANVFVFPSRDEGMPNAVLEAMASGLPIVATRIAGNEELVTPDVGILVPKEDEAALKDALERLLTDPATRERMGTAARQRVLQHYTWDATAQRYLQLLREAL